MKYNKTIKFTKAQLDAMSQEDMNKIIFCTNDGQGDTDVYSIAEMRDGHENDNDKVKTMSNSQFIDYIYEDTNGNMTTCIYLDGSQILTRIRFTD